MVTIFTDFHGVYHWLRRHPAFFYNGKRGVEAIAPSDRYGFWESLEVDVVKVDPTTERIEDDEKRNTATRIWLECGPWGDPKEHAWDTYSDKGIPSHDIDLDCGGKTFEEAIIKLARLVNKKYGDHDNNED